MRDAEPTQLTGSVRFNVGPSSTTLAQYQTICSTCLLGWCWAAVALHWPPPGVLYSIDSSITPTRASKTVARNLIQWFKLRSWEVLEIAGSNPAVAFKFQRSKFFLLRSLVKIQYCGEPPWPRGIVLDLRPAKAWISNPMFRRQWHHSSLSSHDPREVLMAQFSLYVHTSGLNPIYFIAFTMFTPASKTVAQLWSFFWCRVRE